MTLGRSDFRPLAAVGRSDLRKERLLPSAVVDRSDLGLGRSDFRPLAVVGRGDLRKERLSPFTRCGKE